MKMNEMNYDASQKFSSLDCLFSKLIFSACTFVKANLTITIPVLAKLLQSLQCGFCGLAVKVTLHLQDETRLIVVSLVWEALLPPQL